MSVRIEGIPVIETERLRLRGPRASDFPAVRDFLASDRSAGVGGPYSTHIAWRAFGHLTGHWVLRGYSMFVLADRASDRPLGMCGPWFPETWPEPEIGWTLWDPAAEGTGLAFEGAQAARAWAYDVLGWTTAISLISEDNSRSQALARRLGCVPEAGFHRFDDGASARIWRHPAQGGTA